MYASMFVANPVFTPRPLTGICPVCGENATFDGFTENIRESGICSVCHSFNRQRQMAYVLRKRLGLPPDGPIKAPDSVRIYNTETMGALQLRLGSNTNCVGSEYFGENYTSGEFVNGVRHENLQSISFADDTFDVVLSSDVLEHMPEPYRAHREIFRILRRGGCHIFTVPFSHALKQDDVRAVLEGGAVRFLSEPLYHGDPVRPDEGILVWTIFGLEMLEKLRSIGFHVTVHNLHSPEAGIVGDWPIVFEAVKPFRLLQRVIRFFKRTVGANGG